MARPEARSGPVGGTAGRRERRSGATVHCETVLTRLSMRMHYGSMIILEATRRYRRASDGLLSYYTTKPEMSYKVALEAGWVWCGCRMVVW
jgi:hypothetical protein